MKNLRQATRMLAEGRTATVGGLLDAAHDAGEDEALETILRRYLAGYGVQNNNNGRN